MMSHGDGTPIWYELMTDTPDAAQSFYGGVMDWTFHRAPGAPGRDYRIITASDGAAVGGIMNRPEGAPFGPAWAIYFSVSDVDATARKVTSLGGEIHMPPQNIPGVGRFAFAADPQGAFFYLMRGDSAAGSTAFAPRTVGHCTWNELVTPDPAAALDFYGALFGWERTGAKQTDAQGRHTFHAQGDVGMHTGIAAMRDDQAGPLWSAAFHLPDLDTARTAIETGGGHVISGPERAPRSDDWLMRVADPQGALLAVTGPRSQAG